MRTPTTGVSGIVSFPQTSRAGSPLSARQTWTPFTAATPHTTASLLHPSRRMGQRLSQAISTSAARCPILSRTGRFEQRCRPTLRHARPRRAEVRTSTGTLPVRTGTGSRLVFHFPPASNFLTANVDHQHNSGLRITSCNTCVFNKFCKLRTWHPPSQISLMKIFHHNEITQSTDEKATRLSQYRYRYRRHFLSAL